MPIPKEDQDLVAWLAAFHACRSTAFHHIPDDVYTELRTRGWIDFPDHDVTPEGLQLLKDQAE